MARSSAGVGVCAIAAYRLTSTRLASCSQRACLGGDAPGSAEGKSTESSYERAADRGDRRSAPRLRRVRPRGHRRGRGVPARPDRARLRRPRGCRGLVRRPATRPAPDRRPVGRRAGVRCVLVLAQHVGDPLHPAGELFGLLTKHGRDCLTGVPGPLRCDPDLVPFVIRRTFRKLRLIREDGPRCLRQPFPRCADERRGARAGIIIG